LRGYVDSIRSRGAELVVVGNGSAEQAGWFVQDMGLVDIPVFTDPGRQVYRELGARRGGGRLLHPGGVWSVLRAMLGGHRQSGVKGDAAQLGGVFVIRPDGSMPYQYRSRFAGDHPDPTRVLEAI
jgi:hypothetical protein